MTTTRRRPSRAQDVPSVGMTLTEFDLTLGGEAGEYVGFYDAVTGLWRARQQLKMVEARKAEIRDVLLAHFARGEVTAGMHQLKYTRPTVIAKMAVRADDVKKADKRLWEQCRVLRPRVVVKAAAEPEVAELPMPHVPDGGDLGVTIQLRRQLSEIHADLRRTEEQLKTELGVIATRFGWDGTPRKFTDGWTAQTTALMFDPEKLREIDPAAYAALEREVLTERAPYLYIGKVGVADEDEQEGDL